ncbi:Uncharacterized protein family UPF0324 [Oceanithermus profundus DSM 14977]|uniref:Uncharacterized protein family UPF0324 n=1 Tax=Oceanithermus profundus (strain DSM 14977 / NBRC 100410 / VKM B-2274 / 506) TaxID=670487 RepID=E4U763_OCEP5|nr:YeiH family protein [Oceanithermus profundus]ADR36066.1 Uncharacterized protein family UPF0324 [Oceanithermus profundus DSM 14977]
MPFSRQNAPHTFHGLLFVALFSLAAFQISAWPPVAALRLSPLIVGIVLGMFYANTLRGHLPATWVPGIQFSAKTLLRLAVVLYGFRITFQQIAQVGAPGLIVSTFMLATTFLIGAFVGVRLLRMDRDTTLLTASGSSVCGAAAVLATEATLDAKPYKSAVAVGTVVLFGTLSMFLYPLLFRAGVLQMDPAAYGLYVGATVHEVAQVVGAGSAVSPAATDSAVIVKMTRVMLLVPLLLMLGVAVRSRGRVKVPWFAVYFVGVAAFHSLHWLPDAWVREINVLDTFLLTMAMTALGMETGLDKFRQAGAKPLLLAGAMYVWLLGGGYLLVHWLAGRFTI